MVGWGTSALAQTDVLVVDGTSVGILTSDASGPPVRVAEVQHVVAGVRDQFNNPLPNNHQVRFPSGSPAPDSFFDIFVELAPGGPGSNWAVDSFFDITYRIDLGGAPGGPLPILQAPMGHFAVDSFFDITYRIDFGGAPGAPQPIDMNLDGQLAPGLRLLDLNISNNDWAVDSFFDITYRIGPVGDPPPLTLGSPMMTMRLSGQMVPEPSALALTGLGGLVLLRRRNRI
jgi:hypothetical protein